MSTADVKPAAGLADRVIEGQTYLREIRTSSGLRKAAAELAEHADRLGCRDLFPASAAADAVAAVAVALHESLRVLTLGQITGEHIDKIVVVEAAAVSGLKVRRAVDAVRAAGAHWVSALVLREFSAQDEGTARFGAVDQLAVAG
jgi:orotate phosphoribosyltransferase